ncbi:MAG: hypothetical protein R3E32_00480 [Chitinophagales bacterium]
MLRTYFLQKLKKYSLQLLALQGLVILGLLGHSYFQSLQCQQQKEDLTSIITHYQTKYSTSINSNTGRTLDRMSKEVWELGWGNEFVECALDIRAKTSEIIKAINSRLVSKSAVQNDLEVKNSIQKHHQLILQSLEELNNQLDSSTIDSNDLNTIEHIYSLPFKADKQILWNQYQDIKTDDSYLAYAAKLRNDLRLIESNLVVLLWGKMPILACHHNLYDVSIIAPNNLQQGDTLTANIFLAQKIPLQGRIMIGTDTLADGRIDVETYKIKTDRLGIHTLEGELITKGAFGETKIYPFTHEYTVLPK